MAILDKMIKGLLLKIPSLESEQVEMKQISYLVKILKNYVCHIMLKMKDKNLP